MKSLTKIIIFFIVSFALNINAFSQIYCGGVDPIAAGSMAGCQHSCSQGEYLSSISGLGSPTSFGGWGCNSTCLDQYSYNDRFAGNVYTLTMGSSYTMSINFYTWFSMQMDWAIWVDWDQDGSFTTGAPERYPTSGSIDQWTSQTITVPTTSISGGNHRARLWIQEFSHPPDGNACRTTKGPLSTSLGYIVDFNIIVNVSMPFELLKFNATKKIDYNELNWTVEGEVNNCNFDIEKSFDGNSFTKIGKINGAGNNAEIGNYQFLDKNIEKNETVYYRLRKVNDNGNISYSNVVLLSDFTSDFNLTFNNSIHENQPLKLRISSLKENESEIKITDISGKVVYNNQYTINNGANVITINTNGISNGTYLLSVTNNQEVIVRKFIKQ